MPAEAERPATSPAPSQPPAAIGSASESPPAAAASPLAGESGEGGSPAAEPLPTLEDARALTPDADFSRFVRADVPGEVKNAALKQLFSDPHFNVMDRMDVYIDDYGKPDPIPASMLRQLASSRFLGLFRDEEAKDEPAGGARDDAERPPGSSVAQSQPPAAASAAAPPEAVPPDAHPDLRLQQDDAARPGEAGRGTG